MQNKRTIIHRDAEQTGNYTKFRTSGFPRSIGEPLKEEDLTMATL